MDTHICKLEYYESTTKVIATSNTILVDVHDAYRGLRAPAKITYNDCGQITAFITCFVTHTGAYKLEPNTKFSNRAFSLAMDRLAANKFFTPSDMTVISSPTHSSQVDKGARPPTLGHVAKIPTLETSF